MIKWLLGITSHPFLSGFSAELFSIPHLLGDNYKMCDSSLAVHNRCDIATIRGTSTQPIDGFSIRFRRRLRAGNKTCAHRAPDGCVVPTDQRRSTTTTLLRPEFQNLIKSDDTASRPHHTKQISGLPRNFTTTYHAQNPMTGFLKLRPRSSFFVLYLL